MTSFKEIPLRLFRFGVKSIYAFKYLLTWTAIDFLMGVFIATTGITLVSAVENIFSYPVASPLKKIAISLILPLAIIAIGFGHRLKIAIQIFDSFAISFIMSPIIGIVFGTLKGCIIYMTAAALTHFFGFRYPDEDLRLFQIFLFALVYILIGIRTGLSCLYDLMKQPAQ